MASPPTTHAVSVHHLWRALLCLWLIGLAAINSHGAEPNVAELGPLFQIDQQRDYQFSPDGACLAYVDAEAARNTIVVHTLTAQQRTQRIVLKGARPDALHWLDVDTLLYEAEGRLISITLSTMSHRVLLDNLHYPLPQKKLFSVLANAYRHWEVVHTLPTNAQQLIVKATDQHNNSYIYRYNTANNQLTELANGRRDGVNEWIVARNGKPSLGLISEHGQQTYLAKSHNRWSRDNDAPLLFDFDGESYLSRRAMFEAVSSDEDVVYISENFSTDTFRLVAYSLSQRAIIDVILEDERYDISSEANGLQLLFDDTQGTLVGLHYQRETPTSVWLDSAFKAMQIKLDQRFPKAINRIERWSPDRQKILVKSYDQSAQPTVYIYYPERQQLKHLHGGNAISAEPIAAISQRFTARDGYSLDAYLSKAPNRGEKQQPLVVLPHGGPWARDTWRYDPQVQFFASQGYATLKVNFRGSKGFGLAHLRAGIGEFAGLMLDDIADGVRWAIANHNLDPNNVFIMGASYGGYAAIMSAVRYPELYKGLVATAAPIDLATQFDHFKEQGLHFAYNYWAQAVGDPIIQQRFLSNISPKQHLAKLNTPSLIVHGEDDHVVPVWHAKVADKQLAHNRNGDVVIVNGEGHDFTQIHNRLEILSAASSLFKANTVTY